MSGSRDRKPKKPGSGRNSQQGGARREGPRKQGSKKQGSKYSDKGRKSGGGRTGRGDSTSRSRGATDRHDDSQTKRKLPAAASGLPRHVVEALMRVTPPARQSAALIALAAAAEAFSDGQFHVAVRKAAHAKDLSSRDSTIREILGLASYRIGDWQTALRELRTFRRLSGETTHMPVEMDVLRALERKKDVRAVWSEFRKLEAGPAVKKEARVVFASFLIDEGELDDAVEIVGKVRLVDNPWPEDMRLWYVAARVAALRGERDRAKDLANAILLEDPSFPGLDELDRLIDS